MTLGFFGIRQQRIRRQDFTSEKDDVGPGQNSGTPRARIGFFTGTVRKGRGLSRRNFRGAGVLDGGASLSDRVTPAAHAARGWRTLSSQENRRVLLSSQEAFVADGPLIVQSDKTVLLEVDHPRAAEARQPSRRSPNSSAPRSTSTPIGSHRSPCGMRGPRATTQSRSSMRWSVTRVSRSPSLCSSTSSTPWAATGDCSW